MAILIAYYSRAGENYFGGSYRRIPVGNTRRVAEQLASLTGGDLLELRQAHPYSDDYRTCVAQARADWQQSVRPELLGLPKDLSGYDRIYLGYPNYCGTMPMAVYTFLEHYDFTGKLICPFCTHEGSGLSQTERDIRKAAPGATVTRGLAIHGSHVDEAAPALTRCSSMDCQEIRGDLRATVARTAPHRRKIRERRPPGLRSLASNMCENICFLYWQI